MISTDSPAGAGAGRTPAADPERPSYLEADDVHKSFGGSKALDGVRLHLRKGEIHALVGANGAGKSTLARIIAGHLPADRAEISIGGRRVRIQSPRDALGLGVAMVTQQLSLAPHLSVAENIMLAELAKPGRLRRRRLFEMAGEFLEAVNPAGGIDLSAEAGKLSSAHRQMVEIAKAMSQNPQVIIFDEPTTSLTPFETERLFEAMESLIRQDKALVFVSHRLEEIFTICDPVTVLRDGHNACSSVGIGSLDQSGLIRLISGRELGGDLYGAGEAAGRIAADPPGRPRDGDRGTALEVKHLSLPPKVKDVSFTLRKGEILGLAGLVGAGRSETARAIFGLDRRAGGEIILGGKPYTHNTPRESYRLRLAMIPEDRKTQGAIPDFTVRENVMLGRSAAFPGFGTGYAGLLPMVMDIIGELRLDPRNLRKFILDLSGGMQQKVMLGRALLVNPEILILDEPTQGVDIGTRSDIYAILRRLAARGISMLFISSDFKEVLGICDRVVVLAEGRKVAEFEAAILDEEKLTMFAAPRTSARSTYRLLQALGERWPGASIYWVYFGRGKVYCFDLLDGCGGLGFGAGAVVDRGSTCLAALEMENDSTVAEGSAGGSPRAHGSLVSLVRPRRNARGRRLGYIGLTLPAGRPDSPCPEEFAGMVERWGG
ncbi:MAG: sugar ABC transporter ATP-binding protein [Planctomycetota bacterium]|jgi:ribose transport system ATP-binding protein/rhamnose transport system ATP-binding protein|nr:sugar ABC transporter ATP-binding protein [Planctomycetota bacterium]